MINDNDAALASPNRVTPPVTQVPVLERGVLEMNDRENLLMDDIDRLIRQFLTRPNHQSPYSFTFRWVSHSEPILSYIVSLTIHEPA